MRATILGVTGQTREGAGASESLYRDINEAIERGQWPGEAGNVSFRCECARLRCTQIVRLTVEEYEAVREHSRRFIVAPGHEEPAVESVVERREGYLVVEKRDEAARLAELNDPRR
ncbi:MAG TPA: hypothetical protein VE992_01135 [Solirubrobacteraceae bacterium]|nr:hypothetical protein [Solirubrobacteraceae bacterium]